MRIVEKLALALVLVPLAAHAADGAASPVDEKKAAGKGDYALDTSRSSTEVKLNADATFSIIIAPQGDLKIHPQAPLEVKLKASDGLKPQKAKLGRADVKDASAQAPELQTTVLATQAGAQQIEAQVSFFLCSASWCQRMTDKVVVPMNVTK